MSNNVGIGGNEVKIDASEALNEIPRNRTLIAAKLTPDTPIRPEVTEGIRTVDDIFDHYQPQVKVGFEDQEGGTVNEEIKFSNLGDFGKKGIVNNSEFLQNLEIESTQYKKMIKQLKSNKILKAALQDPDAKKSLLNSIGTLVSEIKSAQ